VVPPSEKKMQNGGKGTHSFKDFLSATFFSFYLGHCFSYATRTWDHFYPWPFQERWSQRLTLVDDRRHAGRSIYGKGLLFLRPERKCYSPISERSHDWPASLNGYGATCSILPTDLDWFLKKISRRVCRCRRVTKVAESVFQKPCPPKSPSTNDHVLCKSSRLCSGTLRN
jgi:hypothetical protein